MLGCLQPGQLSSIYLDALNRLCEELHFLKHTLNKIDKSIYYWFQSPININNNITESDEIDHLDELIESTSFNLNKYLSKEILFQDTVEIAAPDFGEFAAKILAVLTENAKQLATIKVTVEIIVQNKQND